MYKIEYEEANQKQVIVLETQFNKIALAKLI